MPKEREGERERERERFMDNKSVEKKIKEIKRQFELSNRKQRD